LPKGNAYQAAFDPAEFDEIIRNLLYQIYRDGKTVTGIRSGGGHDVRINTDELTIGIDQRATAIAFVDDGIGLYKRLNGGIDYGLLVRLWIPPPLFVLPLLQFAGNDAGGTAGGTDNTRGNCRFQAQRVAYRQYPFADADFVRITESDE